jgi:hypothetical protein
MAEIEVTETGSNTFRVVVKDGGSSSEHRVTLGESDIARVPDGSTQADLVEASFRFLLEREPKESILSSFELGVISRYFPEYEDRIADYL